MVLELEEMSHWNYRIVRENGALFLTEVYYDDDGKPNGYIPDGCHFACVEEEEGREGIVKSLQMALKDAEKAPIINAEDMGREII